MEQQLIVNLIVKSGKGHDMKTPIELFGVECGKGWHELIRPLIERCKEEGVVIAQIKEKYGTLRFYTNGGESEELRDMIHKAEDESGLICEDCGSPGVLYTRGWLRTLCDSCQEIWEN